MIPPFSTTPSAPTKHCETWFKLYAMARLSYCRREQSVYQNQQSCHEPPLRARRTSDRSEPDECGLCRSRCCDQRWASARDGVGDASLQLCGEGGQQVQSFRDSGGGSMSKCKDKGFDGGDGHGQVWVVGQQTLICVDDIKILLLVCGDHVFEATRVWEGRVGRAVVLSDIWTRLGLWTVTRSAHRLHEKKLWLALSVLIWRNRDCILPHASKHSAKPADFTC
ncbi:hypothetical protein KCU62_g178, partial [Aureobasidium sp. EXF-3399]